MAQWPNIASKSGPEWSPGDGQCYNPQKTYTKSETSARPLVHSWEVSCGKWNSCSMKRRSHLMTCAKKLASRARLTRISPTGPWWTEHGLLRGKPQFQVHLLVPYTRWMLGNMAELRCIHMFIIQAFFDFSRRPPASRLWYEKNVNDKSLSIVSNASWMV